MKLYVLFAQFDNQPSPVAMAVVDVPTIVRSPHQEPEYLRLALDNVRENCDEKAISWSWFEVNMALDTEERIRQSLVKEQPSFVAHAQPASVEQRHTHIPGITVTIGRQGKPIKDDEIFE